MKKMDEYVKVRRLHLDDGLSIRAIARRTKLNRRTVRKMIAMGAPAPYRRAKGSRPRLDAVTPLIDSILEADRKAPRKQRHTAMRIWERLCEEHGYEGGYTQVRAYVRNWRMRTKEKFVPLALDPATAQVDWGEAWASERGERVKMHLFVMTLARSNARFVMAFPRESQEFFFEGHLRAFEFFGGVPVRIIYDNLKAAVTKVLRGRRRELNAAFEAFAQHYLFTPSFCNVASGNEKGSVEAGVKWAQRRLMTPIPAFDGWRLFNARLREQCTRALEKPAKGTEIISPVGTEQLSAGTESFSSLGTEQLPEGTEMVSSLGTESFSAGTEKTIGEALEEERRHLRPLPALAPERLRPRPAKADSLSLVRFDTNAYSVPTEFAHRELVVEADVCEVRIYRDDACVAVHERCHAREAAVYNPLHYLPLIERKPRALDDGAPMKSLQFPGIFDVLRRRMEAGQEHSEGTRAYIRVLRLLEKNSLADLERAVGQALDLGAAKEEAVKNLLLCPPERTPSPLDLKGRDHLRCDIAPVDLSRYGQLANGGVS